MPTLYIMVGVPGAGKTTYAKNELSHAVYIGADALREQFYGKEMTLRGYRRIHHIMLKSARKYLRQGHDVVIDCTNISVNTRKQYQSILSRHDKIIAVYVNVPVWQALLNNSKRRRHVPMLGILFMHLRLKKPHKAEGFSKIIKLYT